MPLHLTSLTTTGASGLNFGIREGCGRRGIADRGAALGELLADEISDDCTLAVDFGEPLSVGEFSDRLTFGELVVGTVTGDIAIGSAGAVDMDANDSSVSSGVVDVAGATVTRSSSVVF